MPADTPHYLLISETFCSEAPARWRFVLRPLSGGEALEAADTELDARGERLELLAVVRGLEALPQPSRVTLQTPSQYVRRGIAYGLEEWRASGWTWEHFGQMVLVKNHDLWQRLDRALRIHQVECRQWRFDQAHRFGDGMQPQPAWLPIGKPPRRGLAAFVARMLGRNDDCATPRGGASSQSPPRLAREAAACTEPSPDAAPTTPLAARRRNRTGGLIVRTKNRDGALSRGATQTVWA